MSGRSYVNNAQNRSIGRVGMSVGSMPVSRGSSASSGSGNSSSASTRAYVDSSYNRSQGRVGMAHGTAVVSQSAPSGSYGNSSASGNSASTKTYVDNSYNRSQGRVGMAHGTAVVSKSASSGPYGNSSASGNSGGTKRYVDNSYNRSRGRVGKEHGSAVVSKSDRSTTSKMYVDNALNRSLGRVGKPFGSMPHSSRKSKDTNAIKDMYQKMRENAEEEMYMGEHEESFMDLINRLDQVELWQVETGSKGPPKTTPDLLDHYDGRIIPFEELDLRKQIGHGGFGDVYFAKWNGSVVAVKKLRVQRVSKKRLKEFTDELLVFCSLDHPNVVKFIGACVVTPNLAIVMEYVQECLYDAIHIKEDREFSEGERLSIIMQIMQGLKYLHAREIAHCDLKSKNVLLDMGDHPIVKLTDFGLSMMKVESESSVSTAESVRNIGTPRYAAPEVLRGELLKRKDMMKADMYSASLVVFEVICEEEPFPDLRYAQLVRYVGKGTCTPDIPSNMQIFSTLIRALEDCWSRDADKRPTAGSFLSTVESLSSLIKV